MYASPRRLVMIIGGYDKPRLHQRPSSLLFIAPRQDVWPIANQSDPWRGAHSGIAFSHSDCCPSFMRNKCAC